MDRKQPTSNERSNDADRNGSERRGRTRGRSGEGSESALATLKHIERDRARSRPVEDDSGGS